MRLTHSIHILVWLAVSAVGCGGPPTKQDRPVDVNPPVVDAVKKQVVADTSEERYRERLARLHDAVERGQISRFEELLKDGANINDQDERGETLLMKAAAKGRLQMAVLLLARHAAINERDNAGETALIKAASNGHIGVVDLLIAGAGTAEQLQALTPELKDLKLPDGFKFTLGDKGKFSTRAKVDMQDKNGQSALMRAAASGHREVVKALLNAGADRKVVDNVGRIYRFMEAESGSLTPADASDFLLADHQGQTLLMAAVGKDQGRTAVELLDAAGAEWYAYSRRKDSKGKTAQQLADEIGKTDAGKTLQDYLKKHANRIHVVDGKPPISRTPLSDAADAGDLDAVTDLLKNGARAQVDGISPTPLIRAAKKGHVAIAKLLLQSFGGDQHKEREAYFMAGEARALPQGIGGIRPVNCTSLWIAAHDGRIDVVRVILESFGESAKESLLRCINFDHDAYAVSQGDIGTALRIARRHRHEEIVALLTKYGGK